MIAQPTLTAFLKLVIFFVVMREKLDQYLLLQNAYSLGKINPDRMYEKVRRE